MIRYMVILLNFNLYFNIDTRHNMTRYSAGRKQDVLFIFVTVRDKKNGRLMQGTYATMVYERIIDGVELRLANGIMNEKL